MNENFNYCHVVGKTDVGRKRAANEDNMYNTITQNGLVSVVCDGMGGHVGGATASKIAVSAIIDNLNNIYYDDPRIAIGESIDKANKAIIQRTIEQPELSGMGSTCVLLLVRDGKVYIGHVGDSRIYLVRSKTIVQLTKDHSYVQMLVDCGEITKEQAEHHPRKNEITNALGIPNMSPATVADDAIIPEAGDCFVLCSDGLSGMVSDDVICKVISRQAEMNAQERVDKLVALANENGGVDNITVQLVEFPVSPNAVVATKKKIPTWGKITSLVLLLVALCVGVYFWLKTPQSTDDKKDPQTPGTEDVLQCESCDFGDIVFKKNATIVELVFNESSLTLKRGNKQIYTFSSAFDNNSLKVETPHIETKYNNSLITFMDVNPGDSVIFYITQSDKKKTYKCKFNISNSTNEGLSIPSTAISQDKSNNADEKGEKEGGAATIKVDTTYISLQFKYSKLEKGTKILLNYSAKPKLIFGKEQKDVCQTMFKEISKEHLTFDDLYWERDHKENIRQLTFQFKGESSKDKHTIIIPCMAKNSDEMIIISIELVHEESQDVKENTEGEKQGNNAPVLQTA